MPTTVSKEKSLTDHFSVLQLKPGQYAAVVYNMYWSVGFIEEICAETEEVYVRFMHHSEKYDFVLATEKRAMLGAIHSHFDISLGANSLSQ